MDLTHVGLLDQYRKSRDLNVQHAEALNDQAAELEAQALHLRWRSDYIEKQVNEDVPVGRDQPSGPRFG